MHRRVWVISGVVLATGGVGLSAAGASAYFWDRSQADVIARGVTVGGVDVGGLTATRARALLAARFAERLRQPVELVRGDHTFMVRPTSAGLTVDVDRMVDAAVTASRGGGLYQRVRRSVLHKPLAAAIPLNAALSRSHISLLVRHVSRVIDRPARSASVVP